MDKHEGNTSRSSSQAKDQPPKRDEGRRRDDIPSVSKSHTVFRSPLDAVNNTLRGAERFNSRYEAGPSSRGDYSSSSRQYTRDYRDRSDDRFSSYPSSGRGGGSSRERAAEQPFSPVQPRGGGSIRGRLTMNTPSISPSTSARAPSLSNLSIHASRAERSHRSSPPVHRGGGSIRGRLSYDEGSSGRGDRLPSNRRSSVEGSRRADVPTTSRTASLTSEREADRPDVFSPPSHHRTTGSIRGRLTIDNRPSHRGASAQRSSYSSAAEHSLPPTLDEFTPQRGGTDDINMPTNAERQLPTTSVQPSGNIGHSRDPRGQRSAPVRADIPEALPSTTFEETLYNDPSQAFNNADGGNNDEIQMIGTGSRGPGYVPPVPPEVETVLLVEAPNQDGGASLSFPSRNALENPGHPSHYQSPVGSSRGNYNGSRGAYRGGPSNRGQPNLRPVQQPSQRSTSSFTGSLATAFPGLTRASNERMASAAAGFSGRRSQIPIEHRSQMPSRTENRHQMQSRTENRHQMPERTENRHQKPPLSKPEGLPQMPPSNGSSPATGFGYRTRKSGEPRLWHEDKSYMREISRDQRKALDKIMDVADTSKPSTSNFDYSKGRRNATLNPDVKSELDRKREELFARLDPKPQPQAEQPTELASDAEELTSQSSSAQVPDADSIIRNDAGMDATDFESVSSSTKSSRTRTRVPVALGKSRMSAMMDEGTSAVVKKAKPLAKISKKGKPKKDMYSSPVWGTRRHEKGRINYMAQLAAATLGDQQPSTSKARPSRTPTSRPSTSASSSTKTRGNKTTPRPRAPVRVSERRQRNNFADDETTRPLTEGSQIKRPRLSDIADIPINISSSSAEEASTIARDRPQRQRNPPQPLITTVTQPKKRSTKKHPETAAVAVEAAAIETITIDGDDDDDDDDTTEYEGLCPYVHIPDAEFWDESIRNVRLLNTPRVREPAVQGPSDVVNTYDLSPEDFENMVVSIVEIFTEHLEFARKYAFRYWFILEKPFDHINRRPFHSRGALISHLYDEFRICRIHIILERLAPVLAQTQITHIVLNPSYNLVTQFLYNENDYPLEIAEEMVTNLYAAMERIPQIRGLALLTPPIEYKFAHGNIHRMIHQKVLEIQKGVPRKRLHFVDIEGLFQEFSQTSNTAPRFEDASLHYVLQRLNKFFKM